MLSRIPAFLIILFINLMLINNLYSKVNVKFSAVDSKSKNQVMLDSVRVINNSIGLNTVVDNAEKLFVINFTDVESSVSSENEFYLSQNYPNAFSEETRFNINLLKYEQLNISLSDEMGRLIISYNSYFSAGGHSFRLEGAGLANGIYFITATAGMERKTIKIAKAGEIRTGESKIDYEYSSGHAINTKAADIQVYKNNFTFIGYAKGFVPDTIADVKLMKDTSIVFEIVKSDSPWKFKSLYIQAYIKKAEFYNNYQEFNRSQLGNVNRTWTDTTTLRFIDTLRRTDNPSCKTENGDTIRFCFNCCWSEKSTIPMSAITIVIDTNLKYFKILEFKICKAEYHPMFDSPGAFSHISFSTNSPFFYDNNHNLISFISGNNIKNINNLFYSFYEGYHGHNPYIDSYSLMTKIIDISESSIYIKLVPY